MAPHSNLSPLIPANTFIYRPIDAKIVRVVPSYSGRGLHLHALTAQ